MKKIENSKTLLDTFLADNQELEELTARLDKFNIFKTLRIEQAEIRHSNVLAWLLNPDESHGLGDIVLRRLFSNILLYTNRSIKGLSAAKVELMDFVDIEIRREWKNIDLLIVDRNNKIVMLIENKVKSGESPGQLVKYQEIVKEQFPKFKIVSVFLTLTGQESSDEKANEYIEYSYIQLLGLLEKLFNQRCSQLSESVAMFLSHYIDILRRLTMQDDNLIELCKTIYRKHRDAIDTILEYGISSTLQQVVEDVLKEKGGYEILYSRPAYVWFLPDSWTKIVPANAIAWTHMSRQVSVSCRIAHQANKIYTYFELCEMNDPDLRLSCVNGLKKAGFKLTQKAFAKNAKYSRFYRITNKVADMGDYKNVKEVVEKQIKKSEEEFPKAEKVFREVFK